MADPSGPKIEPEGAPKVQGPLRIHLEFEEQRCFLSEWASDLGEGGLFVATEFLYPPGTPVTFQCLLGRKGPLLTGEGEVAWIKTPSEEDRSTGLGLRIVVLTTPNSELLTRALDAVSEQGEESFDLEEFARQEAEVNTDPDAPTEELQDTEALTTPEQSPNKEEVRDALDDTAPLRPPPASGPGLHADGNDDEDPVELSTAPATEAQARVTEVELRQGPPSGEWRRPPAEAAKRRSSVAMQVLAVVAVLMLIGGFYLLRERLFFAESETISVASEKTEEANDDIPAQAAELVLALPAPDQATADEAATHTGSSDDFRQVSGIRVRVKAHETQVIIQTDGLVPDHRFAHFRLDGPSPREVVQLFELAAPQRPAQLNVDGRLVRQVRTGFHDYDDGNELRVVLDLQTAAARVDLIEVEGSDLMVRVVQSGP